MKLGEITEVGFYKEVNGEDIWECFENTDSDKGFRILFPLLLDSWLYQYTDENDRKIYECDGLLYKIGYDYPDLEVEKVTDVEYECTGSMGTTLTEKKPTYKERYLELKKWQEANKPTGICETCTEKANKEADKYKALLNEVVMYCEEQDLKNDITACNIISMIEKEGIQEK